MNAKLKCVKGWAAFSNVKLQLYICLSTASVPQLYYEGSTVTEPTQILNFLRKQVEINICLQIFFFLCNISGDILQFVSHCRRRTLMNPGPWREIYFDKLTVLYYTALPNTFMNIKYLFQCIDMWLAIVYCLYLGMQKYLTTEFHN